MSKIPKKTKIVSKKAAIVPKKGEKVSPAGAAKKQTKHKAKSKLRKQMAARKPPPPPPTPEQIQHQKDIEEISKRCDWQGNDNLITDAYLDILLNQRRTPKLKELADKTGLDIMTVHRHLHRYDFKQRFQEYRHATALVVNNLLKVASTTKNVKAMELWMKTFEGANIIQKLDVTSAGEKLEPAKQERTILKLPDGVELEL